MKIAALDLGSNTFLCLICDVDNGRISKIYDDQVRMVRLGQGVSENKKFHPEALGRARAALAEFAEIIKKHKPDKILAMATAAARDVSNAEDLFLICKEFAIPVEIIPGNKEAQITFEGGTSGISDQGKFTLVIDIGGGSTELILGTENRIEFSHSVNTGCVKLKEKFIPTYPVSYKNSSDLEKYIHDEFNETLSKIKAKISNKELVALAVAGTPTELARIDIGGVFDPQKIDGHKISIDKLLDYQSKLQGRSVEQIQNEIGVNSGRSDVLLPGVIILKAILSYLSLKELTVSTRGVRFGVALEVFRRN